MSSRKLGSSSSSEDDENRYAMIIDEKKRKRMISNRESARRSRMKREQHIKDLNDQVAYFRAKSSEIAQKVNAITDRYMAIESENRALRMQSEELRRRLQLLEEMSYVPDAKSNESSVILDILHDPLLEPWMQPLFQPQTIDGIYQF